MAVRARMRGAGLLLAVACAIGAAPSAEAAGVPELLDRPGYLIKKRSGTSDGSKIIERVQRLGLRDGRIKATVNVLARVDPSYSRRPLDGIKLAVRCADTLWVVRETFVDAPDGFGSDVINRVYRVTAADSVQLTEGPFAVAGFDASDLQCDADGSGSVFMEAYGVDPGLMRVAPDGAVTEVDDAGRMGALTVSPSGLAFALRNRRVALVTREGRRRVVRPGNARGWNRIPSLVPVGRSLWIAERTSSGPVWLRAFSQRSRGVRVDALAVSADGTFCGGMVVTRTITLSSTEVLFRRGRRVVRRVRSEARPRVIDPARGTVALLDGIYSACGAKTGRLVTRLSTGSRSASDAIGVTDYS